MNTKNSRISLGRRGETQAAEFLAKKGYRLIDRNVRTEYGEIDLIVLQTEMLVFVEVKTRRNQRYGRPEEAINPNKLQRMVDSAQAYLQEHPQYTQNWRIDVVSVLVEPGRSSEFNHFENVTL